VRKRRHESRGLAAGAARFAASSMQSLWARAARHPLDSSAILVAAAASGIIIVNAVALQSESRPEPFIANVPPPSENTVRPKSTELPPARTAEATRTTQVIADPRNDPIAQLIGMSSRILAVQRVLANYGYGQIKPSGVLDPPTVAAIEKFERERRLPVTGRVTERLVSDLAGMAGHPLQ